MRFWMYHGHLQEQQTGEGFDGPVLSGIVGIIGLAGERPVLLFGSQKDFDEAVRLTGWDVIDEYFLQLCYTASGVLKRWNQTVSRFEYYNKWEMH